MAYRYELDINNAINIFKDSETVPFLYQPSWGDGTPWTNKAEAELWAERYIAMLEDETNGRPGPNPSEPFIAYVAPVIEEPVVEE